jgi:hypothetical protein
MKKKEKATFRAVLERSGTGPYWVIARVPVDLKKAWPEWRTRRVEGTVNGFAFRTSLFPSGTGQGYALLVNKKMQAGAGAGPGDEVEVELEPDPREQVIPEPRELSAALRADSELRKCFNAMSPSMRKGFAQFVDQAKGPQTRKKRAEHIAETLMQAIDGEHEAPPLLRVQFERQPLARTGWEAMTSGQRRRHLLGIFFQGTVGGRTRRAAVAVEECVRLAHRKAGKR